MQWNTIGDKTDDGGCQDAVYFKTPMCYVLKEKFSVLSLVTFPHAKNNRNIDELCSGTKSRLHVHGSLQRLNV